jgi:hypothetical protein
LPSLSSRQIDVKRPITSPVGLFTGARC